MTYVEADIVELYGTENETVTKLFQPVEDTGKGLERVQKETQQHVDELRGHAYLEPRYAPSNLLNLLEINVWHRRCVALKAALVAGLGWDLVTDDDNKEEDIDYKRIKAKLDFPNEHPETTFTEICTRTLFDYYAAGNAYIEVSRNLKNEPVFIYPVRSNTIRRGRKLRTGGYYQIINGTIRHNFNNFSDSRADKSRNEMLHFYQYDPFDDYYGTPEWVTAMADIIQDRAYVEYTLNLFKNQLLAKFLIIVEGGKLSEASKTTIKNFLKNQTSVKNAGGTVVLSSDDPNVKIRIEKIDHSFEAKEGSSAKGNIRTFSRDVIIAAHGVLPRALGITTASELGGTGEGHQQLKTFKETVIDPEQQRWETFLNRTIIRAFGDHKWKIKFNEFDITTASEDADYFEKALGGKAWMKVEEVREEKGLSNNTGSTVEAEIEEEIDEVLKRLDFSLRDTARTETL